LRTHWLGFLGERVEEWERSEGANTRQGEGIYTCEGIVSSRRHITSAIRWHAANFIQVAHKSSRDRGKDKSYAMYAYQIPISSARSWAWHAPLAMVQDALRASRWRGGRRRMPRLSLAESENLHRERGGPCWVVPCKRDASIGVVPPCDRVSKWGLRWTCCSFVGAHVKEGRFLGGPKTTYIDGLEEE
jgi:hypothetical protein